MSKLSIPKHLTIDNEEEFKLRRGPWTDDEDALLTQYISSHGQGQWNMLAKYAGLRRSGKSCRLRWLNYLKPDIKRGHLTIEEQLSILDLHSKFGNRWSKIAQHLPGRTDNDIKNYWRTRVQKQARKLKIDSNSDRFIKAVRSFWMPRLLEQVKQISSSSPFSSSSIFSTFSSMEIKAPSEFSSPRQSEKLDNVNRYKEVYSEVPGKLTSANYAFLNIDNSSLTSDKSGYDDTGGFHPDATSAMGNLDALLLDGDVAERDLVTDDMASSIWNMDGLWKI